MKKGGSETSDGVVKLEVEVRGDKRVVEAPLIRRPGEREGRKWPRVEIAGDCMRIGKTTAWEVVVEQLEEKGLPVSRGEEEWQRNMYLKDSYDDSDPVQLSRFLLKSQRWFAKRKFQQVSKKYSGLYVQDLNPEGDFSYAVTNWLLGRLSETDFEEYKKFYYSFAWDRVLAPDLLVYITAGDEVAVSRAEESVRDFEVVGGEYFVTMKRVNQAWLKEAEKVWGVLQVNTDKFDFSKHKKARRELGERVVEELRSLEFRV